MPRVNEEEFVLEAFSAEVYETVIAFLSANALNTLAFFVALFALFVIHQLFIWLSTDPVRAFHVAKILASGVSSTWNTLRTIYNAAIDIGTALIPAWNVAAIHVVQPVVFTALDVVSLVFTGNEYGGILKNPKSFEGHVCDGSEDSAHWCAIQAKYANDLHIVNAESSNVIRNNSVLVMSTAQARRLQALTGQSVLGSLPIEPIIEIVTDITGIIIMVAGQVADLAAHVVWTILHEIAVLVYNLAMTLVKVIASVVMQIFSSGIVQNLLKIGIDIIVVLLVHVALPLLMAFIDVVMCIFNFMMPAGWPEQLRCVEQVCFQEDGDIGMLLTLL